MNRHSTDHQNQISLLEDRINRNADDSANDSEKFELFCANFILKSYNLDDEQISNGIVDGAQDGGVDAIYIFADGELITTDNATSISECDVLKIIVIQASSEDHFDKSKIKSFIETARKIILCSDDDFNQVARKDYTTLLLDIVENYRRVRTKYQPSTIELNYFYCAKKANQPTDSNEKYFDKEMESIIRQNSLKFSYKCKFYKTKELLELARSKPSKERKMTIITNTTISHNNNNINLFLCRLNNFKTFLTERDISDNPIKNGPIDSNLFENNIRAYQGRAKTANKDMQETLSKNGEDGEDFLWLNNGVTIICDNFQPSGDYCTITNPMIVNGLQTSRTIFEHLSEERGNDAILIKVINTDNPKSINKIIRATNNQTAIPTEALYATDTIHINIEDHLKQYGIFYDRRKNFYKEQRKKPSEIISIKSLAQYIISIVLMKPDDALARPSDYFKTQDDHEKIFKTEMPLDLYYKAAEVFKKINNFLKQKILSEDISKLDANNIKYYIGMASPVLLGNKTGDIGKIAKIDLSTIDDKLIEKAYTEIKKIYDNRGKDIVGNTYAKGTEMLEEVKKWLGI